jgi:mRNA-degrading endonuclease RelE of RelBE toxin-antitoxin system
MSYHVQFTPEAAKAVRALRATDAARIVDHCQRVLSVNPTLESQARIKRLAGEVFPPYRLRVDDFRVFYDVDEAARTVMIYGVVSKAQVNTWLASIQEEREHENDHT